MNSFSCTLPPAALSFVHRNGSTSGHVFSRCEPLKSFQVWDIKLICLDSWLITRRWRMHTRGREVLGSFPVPLSFFPPVAMKFSLQKFSLKIQRFNISRRLMKVLLLWPFCDLPHVHTYSPTGFWIPQKRTWQSTYHSLRITSFIQSRLFTDQKTEAQRVPVT